MSKRVDTNNYIYYGEIDSCDVYMSKYDANDVLAVDQDGNMLKIYLGDRGWQGDDDWRNAVREAIKGSKPEDWE